MQQPTRYYISRSGDEPTLRSVRISRPQTDCARGADADFAKTEGGIASDERGAVSPDHVISVKERLQEVIRRRAIMH